MYLGSPAKKTVRCATGFDDDSAENQEELLMKMPPRGRVTRSDPGLVLNAPTISEAQFEEIVLLEEEEIVVGVTKRSINFPELDSTAEQYSSVSEQPKVTRICKRKGEPETGRRTNNGSLPVDASLDVSTKMDQLSAEEINFKRLLRKCQQMVTDEESDGWRFPKYVAALEQMLASLRSNAATQGKRSGALGKRILTYETNLDFLRKLASPSVQTQEDSRKELLEKRSDSVIAQPSREIPESPRLPVQETISPAPAATSPPGVKSPQPHVHTTGNSSVLRPKSLKDNGDSQREALLGRNENMDVLVSNEMGRQEEIAQEMLSLTRALKENAVTANQLVKRDFKVIDKATSLADKNVVRLTKESDKLAEQTKKNTSFWVLFALIGLFGIFVMMVLFMRLFPKPRAHR